MAVIDDKNMPIFSNIVSNKIFTASNTLYLISGGMNIIGSYLITKKLPTNIN